jgi:CheY-like chemotaxis protein
MEEKRPCVLLVDDYADALEMWSLYLRMSGYDVVTASDGQQAIDQAIAAHPAAIVMDLELPVLTGIEAAQRLRQMPATATIPLIAATGYSTSRQLDAARDAGFDLILIKPCDPARLLHEIERLIGEPDRSAANGGWEPQFHN